MKVESTGKPGSWLPILAVRPTHQTASPVRSQVKRYARSPPYGMGSKPSARTSHFPSLGNPGAVPVGAPSHPPAMRPKAQR